MLNKRRKERERLAIEEFERELFGEEEKEKIGEVLNEPTFKDVVYSERTRGFIEKLINLLRHETKHLLLTGFAGIGKTMTAKMLAVETRRPFIYLNGDMSREKLTELLLNCAENSLICVDEVHNIKDSLAELLYPAIEYGEIGLNGQLIKLPNLLFICTTTEPEELPKPLQDRLIRVEFDEPSPEMIEAILKKRGIPPDVLNRLLSHTNNLRVINKLLNTMQVYGEINLSSCEKVFHLMNIRPDGLSELQFQYLSILENGKQSVRNLALRLRVSEKRVLYEIEPDLMRKNLIVVTSRGRELFSRQGD